MKKVKVKFKALVAAVAALVLAVPCAASPVFANSGPMKEFGVTGAGVQIRNENSVLAVESEKLTFNISDLPKSNYGDGDEGGEYASSVTAEYKFVNTSDDTVHTSMAFPLGNVKEYYFSKPLTMDATVTVDGEKVETQTRHTLGSYDFYGDFDEGAAEISDEWYEDGFYKLDTPVTTYRVNVDIGGYSDIIARVNINCDNTRARYTCANGYDNKTRFYFRDGNYVTGSRNYDIYVFGDKSAIDFEWTVQEEKFVAGTWFSPSKTSYRDVDLPVEVTEVVDKDGEPVYPTLKDFVMAFRHSDSSVSELDFYNGVARSYLLKEVGEYAYAGDFRYYPHGDSQFCTWYTYDVVVAPKGSIINSITAPLYPDVQLAYDPYVYTYEYYLSPAKGWASFGTLDIAINTPFYSQGMPAKFVRTETGFSAHYDTLPEGELEFSLCASANPTKSMNWGLIFIIFLCVIALYAVMAVGIFIALIIFLIIRAVKRSEKKKIDG
ncbi:MAG: DUF4424 domain-containing protein [Clostridia bacterium]|nr:DUF4424 domain-containing protein [Clostridia bacterium]